MSAKPVNEPRETEVVPRAEASDTLALRVERLSRENAALFDRLLRDEKRLRGIARAVWRVEEAERRRLAGELHDGIGQTLTALKIRLERLAAEERSDGSDRTAELATAAEVAGAALADTRRLSHLLRPQVLDDLGLVAALRWLSRTLAEAAGFAVRIETEGLEEDGCRLPADDETMLFRVTQEALTNAVKHSEAPGAHVEVVRKGRRVSLTVRDRGAGFDLAAQTSAQAGGGCGLGSMRDRVELCGGRFALESSPGAGTTVRVELSIDPAASGDPP